MCGITGFWGKSSDVSAQVDQMSACLVHRGPDDGGVWSDEKVGIGLGQRRLSIIDLSAAGHQPMYSHSDRFVITFNGEIYNHIELRDQLNVAQWRGSSDTETLLECISAWGVEKTLKSLTGMFAFGLYDKQERVLTIARDRFGEKPMYCGYVGGSLGFASELKAITKLPGFTGKIHLQSLQLQTQLAYVPEPYSIYEGIYKLIPGCYLEFTQKEIDNQTYKVPVKYWSATETAIYGIENPITFGSDQEAKAALDQILSKAVKGQMMADVPLGAFLSGGIDSSAIVALMQKQSNTPIKTFTIGFEEMGFDEAPYAREVANYLGTDHTELYLSAADVLAVVSKLGKIYDEPFADASQIPSILVSELAKSKVTVSISGDGGDELFGGYSRHFLTKRMWGPITKLPMPFRKAMSGMINSLPPKQWDHLYRLLTLKSSDRLIGDKLYKAAKALNSSSPQELYFNLVTYLSGSDIMTYDYLIDDITHPWVKHGSTLDQMMIYDTITYLPSNILVKMDRAAMSVSLESRIPFLDHHLYEFAWRLDEKYKIRDGVSKWLLREVLYDYVPKKLVHRPKMGFSVPIGEWLRKDLKEWAEELLDVTRLNNQGLYNAAFVRKIWDEHQSGRKNWEYQLWNILMFQNWLNYTEG
jgi:asparagine synthase (glutamine-hydrolysing)